jgi:hypothetical protein
MSMLYYPILLQYGFPALYIKEDKNERDGKERGRIVVAQEIMDILS